MLVLDKGRILRARSGLDINRIIVTDVGDGLCSAFSFDHGATAQMDVGDGQNGESAAEGYDTICRRLGKPSILFVSHFHADHYNGLFALQRQHRLRTMGISNLYYPRMPDFPDKALKREFLHQLLAMNRRVFGGGSTTIAVDLIEAIKRLNGNAFDFSPCFKGQRISFAGRTFEVLWPPSLIEEEDVLKDVKTAIERFEKAQSADETLDRYYRAVRYEETAGKYLDGGSTQPSWEGHQAEESDRTQEPSTVDNLPELVKDANEAIRRAANHLSLALRQGRTLLFLGDCHPPEIRKIVSGLVFDRKLNFSAFLTPHHGTQWDKSLFNLRAETAISSVGQRLIQKLRAEFKDISDEARATYSDGDVDVWFTQDG